MNSVKSVILMIVIVVGGWLLAKGVGTVIFEQQLKDNSPIKMSKQEYLDYAVPNCAKDGLTAGECRCFYSDMIDKYDIEGTYRFDLDAIDSNYEPPQEVVDMVVRCLGAVYST